MQEMIGMEPFPSTFAILMDLLPKTTVVTTVTRQYTCTIFLTSVAGLGRPFLLGFVGVFAVVVGLTAFGAVLHLVLEGLAEMREGD